MAVIHHPHDHIFKFTFRQKTEAIGFLRENLPPKLVQYIDFDSLEVYPSSYIDDELKEHESDLIYKVLLKGKVTYLYILFEHQRKQEPLMIFRLLKYMVKFWEDLIRATEEKEEEKKAEEKEKKAEEKEQTVKEQSQRIKKLPPVFAMMLSQNEKKWTPSLQFHEVIDLEEDLWPLLSDYIPQFQSALIDLSELHGEQIRAELFGKIVLQAMKAVVQGNVVAFIEENASLIQELLKSREGALGLLETLLKYLFQTASKISKEEFQAVVSKNINPQSGEQVMTLAESLLEEGKREGKREGKKEGKEEGKEEERKGTFSKQLHLKFRKEAESYQALVNQLSLEQLGVLTERILFCDSIEEVFRGMELLQKHKNS